MTYTRDHAVLPSKNILAFIALICAVLLFGGLWGFWGVFFAIPLATLFKAVLIHVTEFFRDPEMFEVLQSTVIPALLANRPNDGPIRVWVVGCASGEEVYSTVMAFLEVEAGLGDLSISRPSSRLSWGIPVPDDAGRVP